MSIVHHHLIFQAAVGRNDLSEETKETLEVFLNELVTEIGMQKLFEPIVVLGRYGLTGMVGIVTSHIAFHYFLKEQCIQFDIYSCKEFDVEKTVLFLKHFWQAKEVKTLCINREINKDFVIQQT